MNNYIQADTYEGLMTAAVEYYHQQGTRVRAVLKPRAANREEFGADMTVLHLYSDSAHEEAHIPVTHQYGLYSATLSAAAWKYSK